MELNQQRIEDAIVQEVADRMIGDEELYSRVKRALDAKIDTHFRDVAEAQIKVAVEEAIKDGFAREYQRVNSFGERQGEKTTIRAELERMIGGYWNEKVDRNGKPTSGYNAETTRAEWMMMQLVASDFKDGMKQHVVNLGGTLKDKLRGELHETINRMLGEVFHVNSSGDQAEKRNGRNLIDPKQGPVTT